MSNLSEEFFQVTNVSKGGIIIAQRVALAERSEVRRTGLLGKNSLHPDEGIYLVPCEWLHTFGMRFSIDVAFISNKGLVLAVHHGLKPKRLSKIVLRAEGALELSPGRLRSTNTEKGDTVRFLDIPSLYKQTL